MTEKEITLYETLKKNKSMFKRIMLKALKKFEKEQGKHGDSWMYIELDHMRQFMQQHILKWKNNRFQLQREKEIEDLLDIINYCIMIIERLNK